MNIENTKAQMRKGILEFCILSLLKDKDCYTSELLEMLKDAKLLVVEGTVYPLLTRLKNDELLSYRWEESTSGPPRKYYKLTELGETFLKELGETSTELSEAINIITKNNNNEKNRINQHRSYYLSHRRRRLHPHGFLFESRSEFDTTRRQRRKHCRYRSAYCRPFFREKR